MPSRGESRPTPLCFYQQQSALLKTLFHLAGPSNRQSIQHKCELGSLGSVLRANFVIGISLLGSLGSAAAQYLPPQPPPVGYPPPASYSSPASPPRYPGAYSYGAPGVFPPQGPVVAALPPGYQPERTPANELPPRFHRTLVDYPAVEPPGTIIIDTPNTYLYLTMGHGKALRYGIGVGREGFTWSGTEHISRMKEWPDWLPPPEMIKRQPYLPRFMAGGETNPLGARAMYLGNTQYRIHGTNQPSTIGSFVSSGCIRLTNEDVEDLYSRVTIGTTVVVLPGANELGHRSIAARRNGST